VTAQGFLAFKARLKQDFGKVMARFLIYNSAKQQEDDIATWIYSCCTILKSEVII